MFFAVYSNSGNKYCSFIFKHSSSCSIFSLYLGSINMLQNSFLIIPSSIGAIIGAIENRFFNAIAQLPFSHLFISSCSNSFSYKWYSLLRLFRWNAKSKQIIYSVRFRINFFNIFIFFNKFNLFFIFSGELNSVCTFILIHTTFF